MASYHHGKLILSHLVRSALGLGAILGGASFRAPLAAQALPPAPRVRPGIDVLLTDSLSIVAGKRIGLVTNLAAVDRQGVSDIDRLRAAKINLVALFAPEHGLEVKAAPGEHVGNSVDSATRTPIYSLYGATTAPTAEMLRGIDVLLVDLPDVGARYFTYISTTIEVMKAAGKARIPVVVLDRPNPLGDHVSGNVLDTVFRSPVGALAVPMQHGMTLAEESRLAKVELGVAVDLRVVPVAGWTRSITFDGTGLPFRSPSPNLKDLEALFHYPGLCLFEGTNLSVGRGTDFPFHQIGVRWLDTTVVLKRLRNAIPRLTGVRFEGVTFGPKQPGDGKSADTMVAGIRLVMTDEKTYDAVLTAVTLLEILHDVYPKQFAFGSSFDRLAGGKKLRESIEHGEPINAIVLQWRDERVKFEDRLRTLSRTTPIFLYR